jgi:hypothetical protein
MNGPPCSKCAHYVPSQNPLYVGYCKRVIRFQGPRSKSFTLYEFADKIRKDEHKCGSSGYMFEKNVSAERQAVLKNLFEDDE